MISLKFGILTAIKIGGQMTNLSEILFKKCRAGDEPSVSLFEDNLVALFSHDFLMSDTCYRKQIVDTTGPILQEEIGKYFLGSTCLKGIVPDEIENIKDTLELWTKCGCNVILTTGGTGFSARDVTPEATKLVIQKEAPGIAYAMLSRSLAVSDMAMLSRAVCGINSRTLIVNLPGSAREAVQCFNFIRGPLTHAVALLTDDKDIVANTHQKIQETPTESTVKQNNAAGRDRGFPYSMLEVDQAYQIIMRECTPTLEKEVIPFDEALNRVLAEDVLYQEPVPPFRTSSIDGYAVEVSDGVGKRIVREITAIGDKPCEEELKPGEVIRICTGAPVPPGADAVVRMEDTTVIRRSRDGTQEEVIKINVAPKEGQNIRDEGSDIEGVVVLHTFDRISYAHIGVLGTLGKTTVKVFKRKYVGILSTGNELNHPSEPFNKLRDGNKCTLLSLLKRYSYDCTDCGTAEDRPDSVKNALEKAFASNAVVITSGSVSMGEYDILKEVITKDFNANIHFARLNMKPGKPTTFATLKYKDEFKIFFGLPGNPVSCSVTALLFVIPALRCMESSRVCQFPSVSVNVGGTLKNHDERPEYHTVKVTVDTEGKLVATSTLNQISSSLNSFVGANGLAIVKKEDNSNINANADGSSMRMTRTQPAIQPSSTITTMTAIIFDDIV